MPELTIDVRMTEQSDDNNDDDNGDGDEATAVGQLRVRVADQAGSVLSAATVTVSQDGGSYQEEKSPSQYTGAATFDNVPVAALTVAITRTGYESVTVDVAESDWDGPDITRGY